MTAGELNRHITIQEKTSTSDGYNEEIETWSDLCTIWAGVAEIGSKEAYQMQKLFTETSAVFKIRYTERVNNLHRIKYRNRTFDILGILPDSRGTELNISAKEVN